MRFRYSSTRLTVVICFVVIAPWILAIVASSRWNVDRALWVEPVVVSVKTRLVARPARRIVRTDRNGFNMEPDGTAANGDPQAALQYPWPRGSDPMTPQLLRSPS